jgi:hypothetical protein
MVVTICGAGPTGMALAWELSSTNRKVVVYDSKPSAGGSWWEPLDEDVRDLHSHRLVFDGAYVNCRQMFKEMGINWNAVFRKNDQDMFTPILRRLGARDYLSLVTLSARVLSRPDHYKKVTLKDALGKVTEGGRRVLSTLPFMMDGVGWDTMSAYEFVKSFDYVILSRQSTQRRSGAYMCAAMQDALERRGVRFVFNTRLNDVAYAKDSFVATFSNGDTVDEGTLVLCVDHKPALALVKDNWIGAREKMQSGMYECINVLLDYETAAPDVNMYEAAFTSDWKIIPTRLDTRTVSCVMVNLPDHILRTPPPELFRQVLGQLKLPKPDQVRVGWGAHWDGERWQLSQSSGVLSTAGAVPFWGRCSKVALVGMMSPHRTPFASIETSVEIARQFAHETFGTRPPATPLLVTHILMFALIVIVLYAIRNAGKRNRV